MKLSKRHLIILMTLMAVLGSNLAWAEDEIPTSGSYTLTKDVYLTKKIVLTGHLTITTNGNYTIHRKNFNGEMISAGNYNLTITGASNKIITFDGGGGWNGDATHLADDPSTITNHKGTGGFIIINNGALNITYAKFQNGFQTDGSIKVYGNASSANVACNISNVEIKGNYNWATGDTDVVGSGVYYVSGDYHTAKLTNVEIHHCKGKNGTIRTNGGTGTVLTMENCKVHDNYTRCGGVIYWNGAKYSNTVVTVKGSGSEFYNNTATQDGGAFFVETKLDFQDGVIYNNTATRGGGIYLTAYQGSEPAFDGKGFDITVGSNVEIHDNTATSSGGGIFMNIYGSKDEGYDPSGNPVVALFKFTLNGGKIYNNSANVGGGLCVYDTAPKNFVYQGQTSGEYKREFYIKSGSIYGNYTTGTNAKGAAICINKNPSGSYTDFGTVNLEISGGAIYQNRNEHGDGGAICILNNFNMSTQTSTCNVTVKNTSSPEIFGNSCSGNGAGIYVDRGSFTMTGGTIGKSGTTLVPGSSPAVYKTNKNVADGGGGGFYITGDKSSINISGGTIQYNEAAQGGGFYANGGSQSTTSVTGGNIQYNHATSDGGAIYANGGATTVNYGSEAAGKIHHNSADEKGGALYISSTGTLNLYGNTTLEYNRVPFGKSGGGVYLAGKVQAGHTSKSGDVIKVVNNYADADGATITDLNRNNIYLPNPTVNSNHTDVITVVDGGLDLANSSIGLSVPSNFVPVIYCSSTNYLSTTILKTTAIFEDSHSYNKFYSASSPYNDNYIYLAADTWVQHQSSEPASGFSVSGTDVTVSSEEGLAWLISYVNNFNGVTGDYTNVDVTLTADIDMSGHKWVPIGYTGKEFTGTFDGGGHTIKGIDCSYINGTGGTGVSLGLFGATSGATIHDVFVADANMMVRNQTSGTYYMGGIVGSNNGSVYNCIASPTMQSAIATTTMGGLVGQLTGGTVHSSAAMADMTGTTMGGLVGNNSSNIYNSFANAKFHSSGSGYVGGLVGVNTGTVENCYAREQSGSSHGSSFGWLAGTNQVTVSGTTTKGNLNYSYAPSTPYTVSGVEGNQTGVSTYGETHTPYLYKHYDNQVATASGNTYIPTAANKQLVATLNNWVNVHSGYSPWMRTCASPINADYPVFKYSDYTCVASTDNVALEYAASFNTKFNEYVTANSNAGHGTIFLYDTPAPLAANSEDNVNVSNNGRNTTLYIGEDVALKPASGTGAINATVGITLDNSAGANGAHPTQGGTDAMDWHMFSTSLQAAPLGINYDGNTEEYPFVWGGHPSNGNGAMPYWRFYPEGDASHGYFPSMEYSWAAANSFTYDATNTGAATNGNWYNDWDYYAYYEKEYHWINFKRNGNSHWHEDATEVKINYKSNGTGADLTNETNLIKGRGYLVSTVEPTYLQCSGTLTTGDVPVNLTSSAWVRKGYNLLGNPYQSYLDFNAFADETGIDSYYIIDEDAPIKGYAKYTKDASENEYIASSYIHPHQGFMVIVDADKTVTFTDAMRKTTVSGSFRGGERPAYPLVNLIATEENGTSDVCTVELGRPDEGGAPVMRNMRICKGLIYCRYDDGDWSIAFTRPGLSEAAIRFETTDDAMFTLTWDTENGDFGYLHLIDNMTGADIDCLQEREYKFTSRTSDYASRFRLVFCYTGIEETEDSEPVEGSTSFAFQTGDGIVVNGEGTLQIIDMTGRIVKEERLRGSQSTVSVPQGAAGVYVLRLTGATGTRVQKIVVSL